MKHTPIFLVNLFVETSTAWEYWVNETWWILKESRWPDIFYTALHSTHTPMFIWYNSQIMVCCYASNCKVSTFLPYVRATVGRRSKLWQVLSKNSVLAHWSASLCLCYSKTQIFMATATFTIYGVFVMQIYLLKICQNMQTLFVILFTLLGIKIVFG